MYELKKYEELYSSLRGKHILESICKEHNLSQSWAIPGHLFVAAKDSRDLYVFDVVPNTVYGQVDYSSDILAEDCLLTEDKEARVLDVLWDFRSDLVFIVYVGGTVHVWSFDKGTYLWERQCEFLLSNTKFVKITAVALHTELTSFVWCEERTVGPASSSVFCVCTREMPRSFMQNVQSSLGPINAVLHNCPPVKLFLIKDGCCIQPDIRPLSDMFLCWHGFSRRLKVFIFSNNSIKELPISDSSDFKGIATELLPLWGSTTRTVKPNILAVTTHTTTKELVFLTRQFQVFCFSVKEGEPIHKKICTLLIPVEAVDKTNQLHIFSHTMIIGVIFPNGNVQVFDLKSGQLLKDFTTELYAGVGLSVWKCLSSVPQMGVWSSHGVWVLISKSIIEIANSLKECNLVKNGKCFQLEANVQSKLNEGAQEDCSTSQQSTHGQNFEQTRNYSSILSVLLSWGLDNWATKFCIDLLASDIKLGSDDEEVMFNILNDKPSSQSLLVVVAAFGKSIVHRDRVLQVAEEFVNSYTNTTNKTSFSDELFPYLQDYVNASKIHSVLERQDMTILRDDFPPLIKHAFSESKELLQILLTGGEAGTVLERRISLLKLYSPNELFEAMKETFFDDDNLLIKECVDDGTASAEKWRYLLGLRVKKGRLVKDAEYNPLLGIFCQLVYHHQPRLLVDILQDINEKDAMASETPIMARLCECMRDNLSVVSVPLSKSSSVKSYAEVLTLTGCYLEALQLLVKACLWYESLKLMSSLCDTLDSCSQGAELYQTLLCGLIKGNAPAKVFSQALKIKPKDFSTLELIALLKQGLTSWKPFCQNETLTVGLMREDLLNLVDT